MKNFSGGGHFSGGGTLLQMKFNVLRVPPPPKDHLSGAPQAKFVEKGPFHAKNATSTLFWETIDLMIPSPEIITRTGGTKSPIHHWMIFPGGGGFFLSQNFF